MTRFSFLILSILITFGCNNQPKSLSENAADASTESENLIIADPFSGTNLVDHIKLVDLENNPVDLKQFAGKKIFLNFWATWCKPCIMEMPSIARAQEKLADENYVFLLASDEDSGRINRFLATRDFQLQFVRLESRFQDIGILSIPATLIIDEQGKIALNHIGAMEWDNPEVLNKLRSLSM